MPGARWRSLWTDSQEGRVSGTSGDAGAVRRVRRREPAPTLGPSLPFVCAGVAGQGWAWGRSRGLTAPPGGGGHETPHRELRLPWGPSEPRAPRRGFSQGGLCGWLLVRGRGEKRGCRAPSPGSSLCGWAAARPSHGHSGGPEPSGTCLGNEGFGAGSSLGTLRWEP